MERAGSAAGLWRVGLGASDARQTQQAQPAPSAVDTGGLQALCVLARLHQVAADPAQLRQRLGLAASEAIGSAELLQAAQALKLKARLVNTAAERLALTPLPALAIMHDGSVLLLAQCLVAQVLLHSRGLASPIDALQILAMPLGIAVVCALRSGRQAPLGADADLCN